MTGDSLPVPSIPAPGVALPVEEVASFLKLILGVAVTCSNKLLFISKIQSLDETTQHALTACIVSFISTKVRKFAIILKFIKHIFFQKSSHLIELIIRIGLESSLQLIPFLMPRPVPREMRSGPRSATSLTIRLLFCEKKGQI